MQSCGNWCGNACGNSCGNTQLIQPTRQSIPSILKPIPEEDKGDEIPLLDTSMRSWTNNTGEYSVQGKLEGVVNNSVRIRKTNGNTSTVRLYDLSSSDITYVLRTIAYQNKGNSTYTYMR